MPVCGSPLDEPVGAVFVPFVPKRSFVDVEDRLKYVFIVSDNRCSFFGESVEGEKFG